MSTSKVFGVIILIIGIILFFANVGTVIDVAGDLVNGIGNKNSGNNQSINNNNSDETKAKAVSSAIEPRNSTVRSLALNAIKKSNDGDYNIGQVCDIFDYLYKNWTYVNDPSRGGDYYAKASESAKLMKGDCDDFAILMASCIESIGGRARYNSAQGPSGGHAYTEVYVTDNLSDMQVIANNITKRYGLKPNSVHYRYESNSNGTKSYWLNLDWQDNYPGGRYFEHTGNILWIKSDGSFKRYTVN